MIKLFRFYRSKKFCMDTENTVGRDMQWSWGVTWGIWALTAGDAWCSQWLAVHGVAVLYSAAFRAKAMVKLFSTTQGELCQKSLRCSVSLILSYFLSIACPSLFRWPDQPRFPPSVVGLAAEHSGKCTTRYTYTLFFCFSAYPKKKLKSASLQHWERTWYGLCPLRLCKNGVLKSIQYQWANQKWCIMYLCQGNLFRLH